MAALAHIMRLEPPHDEFAARRDQTKVLGAMNLGSHPGDKRPPIRVQGTRRVGDIFRG
jgi:hypothetical protein